VAGESKTFEHYAAVNEYAEAHDLAYVWEGTAAFEERKRDLKPEQYQLMAVHAREGVKLVLMFSKDIARAEAKALDTSQRMAKRKARYQKPL
jgi:hypothetical protein